MNTKRPNQPKSKLPKRAPSVPVQIRLAAHIKAELDRIALERGTDRTALIQDAIADWLAARKKKGES